MLCASIVQKSRDRCSARAVKVDTVCATTCASYAESQASIISGQSCGLTLTSEIMTGIRQDYNLCTIPGSAYAYSECVSGQSNEPLQCGLDGNTQQLCNLCTTRQTNGTEECCRSVSTASCLGISDTASNVVPFISPSSSPIVHKNSLGSGLVGGIVACVIAIALVLFFITMILYWKRRRAASLRHRLHTLNSVDPKVNSDNQYIKKEVSNSRTAFSEQANSSLLGNGSSGITEFHSSESNEDHSRAKLDRDTAMSISSDIATTEHHKRYSVRPSNSIDSLRLELTDHYTGKNLDVGSIVTCVHEYEPVLSDELHVRPGDKVQISKVYDDSWCRGIILGSRDTEAKAFPVVCVCASENTAGRTKIAHEVSNATISVGDSQALPRVIEETRPALLTRGSTSRFKEHVGLTLEVG